LLWNDLLSKRKKITMSNIPNHTHTIYNLLKIAAENKSTLIPHRLNDLADILGYSRPTSDRVLRELEQAGMLRFVRTHSREIYLQIVLEKDAINLWMTLDKLADDLRVLSEPKKDQIYLDSKTN
jgi:DNA-binding MarR family transcriptional regulator